MRAPCRPAGQLEKVGGGEVVSDSPPPDNEPQRRGEYPQTARTFGW
jgi:hypothetical protein